MVGNATGAVMRCSPTEICTRLDAERSHNRAAIAFDGDGTLWSGDVGEDLYEAAIAGDAIRDEAGEALARAAHRHGVPASGSPSRIAEAIYDAFRHGRFPERDVCEVMTWCYAGWQTDEFDDFVRDALDAAGLPSRLNRDLEPILEHARATGIRSVVISASPAPAVCYAASLWGIGEADVAAALAALDGTRIVDRMGAELPYAEAKRQVGRALLGDAQWLASFGDNAFDTDMFAAAGFGVAVNPKPRLRRLLGSLPNVLLLTGPSR